MDLSCRGELIYWKVRVKNKCRNLNGKMGNIGIFGNL